MKKSLIIFLVLLNLTTSGQNRKSVLVIDNSNIRPWIVNQSNDYQGSYHFSNSELESLLILNFNGDSVNAKIQSGRWVKKGDKDSWELSYEALSNVKIIGNKFFSNKTNGEFVSFTANNKELKGLMVYLPWRDWLYYANDKGYELGPRINSK